MADDINELKERLDKYDHAFAAIGIVTADPFYTLKNLNQASIDLEDIRNLLTTTVRAKPGTPTIALVQQLITERDGYFQDKDCIITLVRERIGKIIGVKYMPGLEASLLSLEVEYNNLKKKLKDAIR